MLNKIKRKKHTVSGLITFNIEKHYDYLLKKQFKFVAGKEARTLHRQWEETEPAPGWGFRGVLAVPQVFPLLENPPDIPSWQTLSYIPSSAKPVIQDENRLSCELKLEYTYIA